MRIISGYLKGKKINLPKDKQTRPLRDMVKESIFNILNHSNKLNCNIENSEILDLFSGSGSFGLECISRGATKVTFVEKNNEVIRILNKNLSNLLIEDRTIVIKDKIFNFLNKEMKSKYKIIFFDPPFADNDYIEELKLIYKKKFYKNNHVIIIHRERKSIENFDDVIKPLIVKEYGRSKIIFAKFLS